VAFFRVMPVGEGLIVCRILGKTHDFPKPLLNMGFRLKACPPVPRLLSRRWVFLPPGASFSPWRSGSFFSRIVCATRSVLLKLSPALEVLLPLYPCSRGLLRSPHVSPRRALALGCAGPHSHDDGVLALALCLQVANPCISTFPKRCANLESVTLCQSCREIAKTTLS